MTRYTALAKGARDLYQATFYNATTGCYAGCVLRIARFTVIELLPPRLMLPFALHTSCCHPPSTPRHPPPTPGVATRPPHLVSPPALRRCTYVSQVFALALGLAGPQGSPQEQKVWANAMDWWGPSATHGVPEHFGGGIISLKYAMPLLDAHGETGLALKMHLQTDQAPGFGYWIETGGATTLWEAYDMTATEGTASRNHSACVRVGIAVALHFSPLPPSSPKISHVWSCWLVVLLHPRWPWARARVALVAESRHRPSHL